MGSIFFAFTFSTWSFEYLGLIIYIYCATTTAIVVFLIVGIYIYCRKSYMLEHAFIIAGVLCLVMLIVFSINYSNFLLEVILAVLTCMIYSAYLITNLYYMSERIRYPHREWFEQVWWSVYLYFDIFTFPFFLYKHLKNKKKATTDEEKPLQGD